MNVKQQPMTEHGEDSNSLPELLAHFAMQPLTPASVLAFDSYLALILRWNAKTNLTAIRDAEGILRRHFIESIACARALPAQIMTLLDFGSGAGFPGVPIAICRPEITVTLAESQHKKAAFLREVASVVGLKAKVFSGRAEAIPDRFDCVTLRAVDQMEAAVTEAARLVNPGGILALMTTDSDFHALREILSGFEWRHPELLPGSDQRILAFGISPGVSP